MSGPLHDATHVDTLGSNTITTPSAYVPVSCQVHGVWNQDAPRFRPENASAMLWLKFRLLIWLGDHESDIKEWPIGTSAFVVHGVSGLIQVPTQTEAVKFSQRLHSEGRLFECFERVRQHA
jgi:hypothetical protein